MPVAEGWKAKYGGLDASEAKRLWELRDVVQEGFPPRRSFHRHRLHFDLFGGYVLELSGNQLGET